MRSVCAWCDTLMDGAPDDPVVSHGICPECRQRMTTARRRPVRDFVGTLEVPVVAVDGEGVVLAASASAARWAGKDPGAVEGLLGGDFIDCVNADRPGGCGKSAFCTGCRLRESVVRTYSTGLPTRGLQTSMELAAAGGERRVKLRISTEKVEDTVLIKIDEGELE